MYGQLSSAGIWVASFLWGGEGGGGEYQACMGESTKHAWGMHASCVARPLTPSPAGRPSRCSSPLHIDRVDPLRDAVSDRAAQGLLESCDSLSVMVDW